MTPPVAEYLALVAAHEPGATRVGRCPACDSGAAVEQVTAALLKWG